MEPDLHIVREYADLVVCPCNPGAWETEEESQALSHLRLSTELNLSHSKILSQNKANKVE